MLKIKVFKLQIKYSILVFVSCRPTTNAIMGLTFANYVLQPFFNDCAVPVEATQLLAAATICEWEFFLQFLGSIQQQNAMHAETICQFAIEQSAYR